jgi:uncharacterized membrane protein
MKINIYRSMMMMKKYKAGLIPVLMLSALFTVTAAEDNSQAANSRTADNSRTAVVDRDLVIPLKDLSSTVQFYPVVIEGTAMEVLAALAPDGTYRTAFNTCQSCYDSGRGYYRQNGNVLVCQNCGNRFRLTQIEVRAGGCNPVPIFPANKTVDAENITIPQSFLRQAKGIFAQWKR